MKFGCCKRLRRGMTRRGTFTTSKCLMRTRLRIPLGLSYSTRHLWFKRLNKRYRVGVTDFWQEEIGDVVGVFFCASEGVKQLDKHIAELKCLEPSWRDMRRDVVSVIAHEIRSPMCCSIVSINSLLHRTPSLINCDPYGDGWLFEITPIIQEADFLMNASQYYQFLKTYFSGNDLP